MVPESGEVIEEMQFIDGLKIFREIIEIENLNQITCAADWETEDYIQFRRNIEKK